MSIVRRSLAGILVLVLGCGGGGSGTVSRIDRLFGEVPYGTLNEDQVHRIVETKPDSDRPFYLVEVLRFRERAEYPDGRELESTGAAADAIYSSEIEPILADIGARRVYLANVERRLIDPDGAAWDQLTVTHFPSRAQFVALHERRDFQNARIHRIAGVERAIVLVSEAVDPIPEDLRRVDLTRVPFPPTSEDPPVTVVHLLDYNATAQYADGRPTELTGREAMALYEQARASQAIPLGVRPGIWLRVEGELIGDGRPWEEVRINNFPSRATFMELVTAESLGQAGFEDREAALADTYAVLAAPVVNEIGYLDPLAR